MKKSFLLFVVLILYHSNTFAQLELNNNHHFQNIFSEQSKLAVNVNPDSAMIDSIITSEMNAKSIPGFASIIIKNNRIIWNKNYGYKNREQQLPVEDSTIFLIASTSKTFVATAVMQLWENGMIDLESSISNYLPDNFKVVNPYFPNDSITLKMLMTHTSSIQDNWTILDPLTTCGDSPIKLDSFLINYFTPGGKYYTGSNFYNYHPGQKWNYSNVEASLVAMIIENLTGKTFDEYCRDSIFTPLSMNTASYFLDGMDEDEIATPYFYLKPLCHEGHPLYPSGMLRTNKLELSNFLLAYMNNGQFNNSRILDSTTIAYMLTDQLGYTVIDYQIPWIKWRQGLFWVDNTYINDNSPAWGHNGSSYGCLSGMSFSPTENWGFIYFINWRPNDITGGKSEIENQFVKFAKLHGNIYAIRPTVNTNVRKDIDSILFRTSFSNIHHHPFTPYLIYSNSDTTEIDSLILFDDGLHGDLFSNDGTYGVYIPPRSSEDFYSLGVSTIDKQTNKYLYTPDICRFTSADSLTVDSIKYLKDYGDIYNIRVFVRNSNKTKTIKNATINILTVDPWASGKKELKLPDIPPDKTVGTLSWFSIAYNDSTFPGYFNLKFEIMSDGWVYWTDSVQLFISAVGIDDETIQPLTFKLAKLSQPV